MGPIVSDVRRRLARRMIATAGDALVPRPQLRDSAQPNHPTEVIMSNHEWRPCDPLPAPRPPQGNYVPAVHVGNLLYLSGAGPALPAGGWVVGKVGPGGLDIAAARAAARLTGLQLLATMQAELGHLDQVERVVKLFGMVNCAAGFNRTPEVIDGCSNVLVEVLGERGRGARSAVGLAELPIGIAVEIEAVVQIRTGDH
jgi:enamine deaminase RidA (YjgF/YER057c/UK114 family)